MYMWWRKSIEIHIEEGILLAIEEIANTHFPNEAGGALMGYVNDNGSKILITKIIGPGPEAVHNRMSFIPDYAYQEEEIARLYSESERTLVYLGDWHSHPNGAAALSGTDQRTLINISSYPEARIAFPIMVLLSGRPDRWNVNAWQLRKRRLIKASVIS